jgi:hypothetical protein
MVEASRGNAAWKLRDNTMNRLAGEDWTCLWAECRKVDVVRGLECGTLFYNSKTLSVWHDLCN